MEHYERAIIKTLCYSDIFDYPLSKRQLWQYLIGSLCPDNYLFEQALNRSSVIQNKNGWYFLEGRSNTVEIRLKRQKESKKKLRLAQKVAIVFSYIPTVCFIGISGGLAMENARVNDDIDLFIISKKNTVWLTRLLVLVCLQTMGKRRKKGETQVSNKICVNMLLDEQSLCLPKNRQNLYSSHEVAQMRPLFERNETYKKFIEANSWVSKFLPNVFKRRTKQNLTPQNLPVRLWVLFEHGSRSDSSGQAQNNAESFFSVSLRMVLRFPALEILARTVQLWYMRKNITNETIENNFAAFHPFDYRTYVMRQYRKRLKIYQTAYRLSVEKELAYRKKSMQMQENYNALL